MQPLNLWRLDGWNAFIQVHNPGPLSHYQINNETTFSNHPPMWPWAAISFPSNLYSSATASNPGQQLLHTTSEWCVGPWHLISACRSGEQSGELSRWKQQHREVKGQYRGYEYWMPNVISFISAHVSALSATELIPGGSAGTRCGAATIPVTPAPQL